MMQPSGMYANSVRAPSVQESAYRGTVNPVYEQSIVQPAGSAYRGSTTSMNRGSVIPEAQPASQNDY